MQVTYHLTTDDVKGFTSYCESRGKTLSGSRGFLLLMMMMLTILLFSTLNYLRTGPRPRPRPVQQTNPIVSIAAVFAPLVLIGGGYWVLVYVIRARQIHELKTDLFLTEPHLTRIEPDFLYNLDGQSETKSFWRGLHEVGADERCFYFLTTKITGYIVPRRAFETSGQANEFYQAARHHWLAARGLSSDPPIPAPSQTT